MMQVSDPLKPRQLFLQGDFADRYRECGGTETWRPQKHRYGPDRVGQRKRAQKEELKTGVKDAWKPKPVVPLFTKAKVKGKAGKKAAGGSGKK